jgi:hypothetical protein
MRIYGLRDGRTDMTSLVASIRFEKAPKETHDREKRSCNFFLFLVSMSAVLTNVYLTIFHL